MNYLDEVAGQERATEIYRVALDRRPTAVLRLCRDALDEPDFPGLSRCQVEMMAGGAAEILGKLDEARQYHRRALVGAADAGKWEGDFAARSAMELALVATDAAEYDEAMRLAAEADTRLADANTESQCYSLFSRYRIERITCRLDAADRTLAEVRAHVEALTDEEQRAMFQRAVSSIDIECSLFPADETRDLARAAEILAAWRAEQPNDSHRIYGDVCDLAVKVFGGDTAAFAAGIEAIEWDIEQFVSERAPEDIAVLRGEIQALLSLSLHVSDYDRADRLLGRISAFTYPCERGPLGVSRAKILLGRGDRHGARGELRAVLAGGAFGPTEREARELLTGLNSDLHCADME